MLLILASNIAYYRGDYETARSEADKAVVAAHRRGIPTVLAIALFAKALALADDNAEIALAAAEESIALVEAGAGDSSYGHALLTVAMIRTAQDDATAAARAVRTAVAHGTHIGTRAVVASHLALGAVLLEREGYVEAAATVGGALNGPVFAHLGLLIRGPHRERYDRALAYAAAALGNDTDTKAHEQGAAMTYDQAVTFTLDELGRLAKPQLRATPTA